MKHFISTLLLAALIVSACTSKNNGPVNSTVHDDFPDTLTAADAVSDFKTFRQALQTVHPAVYKYTPKPVMDSLLDSLQASIRDSVPLIDFYNKLRLAVSRVHCGHTFVEFNGRMNNYFSTHHQRFFVGLNLLYNNGSYYLQADDSATNLGVLQSVNGHTVSEMFNALTPYSGADAGIGCIDSFKLAEDFFYKYYLYYDRPNFKKLKKNLYATFTYSKNGVVKTDSIQRKDFIMTTSDNRDNLPVFPHSTTFDFAINDTTHTAVLTVESFSFSDVGSAAFKHFVDNSFELLAYKKNIHKLIIDIRNNGGGDMQLMNYLASFTLNSPLKECQSAITHIKQLKKLGLDFHVLDGDKDFVDSVFRNDYDSVAPGRYALNPLKIKQYKPAKNAFRGKVVLLTNHATFSAAACYASLHRDRHAATIVGEEPGGEHKALNGYYQLEVLLPKSQLWVVIPTVEVKFDLQHSNPFVNGAVVPDFIVHQSITGLQHGVDTQMKFAESIGN